MIGRVHAAIKTYAEVRMIRNLTNGTYNEHESRPTNLQLSEAELQS